MPRFLITSADERTWKFDRPVLFLGEWCRLYDRRHVWQHMDGEVAEPYGLEPGQKERDVAYVQSLFVQLLEEMADALNAVHNTNHSVRYWHIVLGHWLQRYVAVLYNRYITLEQALKNHNVSGTVFFNSGNYSLATTDTVAFVKACCDDVWSNVLYEKILRFLGWENIGIEAIPLQGLTGFAQQQGKPQNQSAKRFVRHAINEVLKKLSRKNDAFIINSFLPIKEEAKLQLSLGQCPQIWQSPKLKCGARDTEKRQRFAVELESHTGFERFVRACLGEMIPVCYLEGYGQLMEQVQGLPWPQKPKFIFTSNNFDSDEIFKVWAGLKAEQGVPYFTGQHGNNYGTLFRSTNWPELVTCDRFFTWGWSNGDTKTVPAFIFKTVGYQPQRRNPDGGLLLVEHCVPLRIVTYDNYFEHENFQEEQFRFVKALPEAIQQQLTVRPHIYFLSRLWSDYQRWHDRSPDTSVENGSANIADLISQSRLVVFSYDSTGILENLALNIPTICFWQGGLDHLLPSAKPYYELLRGAGILADSPEQAAEQIAMHWDNVGAWWESGRVQDARQAFCDQYAKVEKNPIRTMRRLLLTHAKQVNKITSQSEVPE